MPNSPAMRDPNAVIYLVPRVGMLSFAKDKATARIAAEFYVNAINVMRGASGVSAYRGLPEQEAFNIEYWLLEEAKLSRMPKPKSAGGPDRLHHRWRRRHWLGDRVQACCPRAACVVLADIDQASLDEVTAGFGKTYGKDNVRGVKMDVTVGRCRDRGHERSSACLRRRRHRRQQCRHHHLRAGGGHDARACGTRTRR